MYNCFAAARSPSAQSPANVLDANDLEHAKKEAMNKIRRKRRTDSLANKALDRREEWIMDASLSNKFRSKFFNGSIPLINSKQHTFRDVDLSNKGFSPCKTTYGSMQVKYPLLHGDFSDKKPMPRLREKLKEIHGKNMNFKISSNKSHI